MRGQASQDPDTFQTIDFPLENEEKQKNEGNPRVGHAKIDDSMEKIRDCGQRGGAKTIAPFTMGKQRKSRCFQKKQKLRDAKIDDSIEKTRLGPAIASNDLPNHSFYNGKTKNLKKIQELRQAKIDDSIEKMRGCGQRGDPKTIQIFTMGK